MRLQPGTFLQGDKYRIIDVLGQGGFGITYLAEQVMAERKVCIKEFFPKEYYNRDKDSLSISLGSQGSAEIMDLYKAKFIKEAKTIAKLDHPNIIHIHDVFAENNTAYYVMEYIEGESLSALVKERGALSEGEAVGYIKQVAAALGNIHEQRIMHLDIKPANIMLRKADGKPVLIDFGLSKQYDAEGNQTSSTPVGISAGYAPMEQYQQGGVKEFSPETDIYSLGASLYYLVTGCVPPQAAAIVDDGLPELPAHLSANVRNAIERSMEIQRKKRPHSMDEFVALLGDGNTAPVVNNVAAAAAPSVEDESTRFGAPLNDESTKFAEEPKAEPKRAEAPKKEWTPKHSEEKPKKSDDNKKKSRWWMWLLGLLLIGGGAYLILGANSGDNDGKTKSKIEQMHDLQEDMVLALENDDYKAFKAVALEVHNLSSGMTEKEVQQAEESLNPELKARAEKYVDRAQQWSYQALMEFIEEGRL
ncbi:MAG: serine/threonine protein kinase [Rikenellaceae bacterium]|nr:serine/threonine protein kinase [Rikenellaceae bacterium]